MSYLPREEVRHMGDAAALITAACGGIGVILGAWALVVKAQTEDGHALHLLRRLWDWIEGKGLDTQVPRGIRDNVVEALYPERESEES